jgi:hypothetical protein
MGFMDKAKEAAEKARISAQQAAQQGQAKYEAFQFDRTTNDLYKALGEAYYAEQRRGGGHDAVVTALGAVDAHLASRPQKADGTTPPPPTPPTG